MPQSRSAKKDVRQIEKRRLRNKARSSAMKTAMRRLDTVVAEGDAEAVKAAVSEAYKRIDKAAKTNIIHANTAARRKSMVTRKAAAAKAS
jgi:small subunit ribosomal protein S20